MKLNKGENPMRSCIKCGTELKEGARICPLCETEVQIENAFETRFCYHCGVKIETDTAVCLKCGAALKIPVVKNKDARTLQAAALVIMEIDLALWVLGYIFAIAYVLFNKISDMTLYLLLPIIPIVIKAIATRYYFAKAKYREPVNAVFKICVFIFINSIAGILMLCDDNGSNQIEWERKIG